MTRTLLRALAALAILAPLLFNALPASAQAVSVTVSEGGPVQAGSTRAFTATVMPTAGKVTWSVNDVAGGDSGVGTISSRGLYRAPRVVPALNVVRIKATTRSLPAVSGSATLTLTQVQPKLTRVSPQTLPLGAFSLTLSGSGFSSNAVVRFAGMALPTTRRSSTRLVATGTSTTAHAGRQVAVDVLATGPGAVASNALMVTVAAPPPPPPPPVTLGLSPVQATLPPGASLAFAATVSGSSNTAVTWSVNGINGGSAGVGTVSATGLYTAPAVVPTPPTVTLRATSVASPAVSASAAITVQAGSTGGGGADLAAARLLDQAAFGPSPADLARVKSLGVANWLNEQFAMPETAIQVPASGDNRLVQSQFLARLSSAPDPLRQRVAYALAQVLVISASKNNYANEVAPFLQILSRHAFGNYRALLGEVALSPQMGKYLDLANSNKPAPGSSANENFPRELLQLFSIGLVRLNLDGSPVLDGSGQPQPTYAQADVQQLALALTGWTYAGTGLNNWENFTGPMVSREVNHDARAKAFLGCSLAAGQTAQQDMTAALDCIFRHPNVGPFVSLRLIRQMVKSNPSPAYVARVAGVFNNNGSGIRGDLRAVVQALLTDPEARDDSTNPTAGRLRDPVQQVVALVRALGGSISPTNGMSWEIGRAGEVMLMPPSVFGFYSPLFRVPGSALAGPEFQIYTPTEAVLRGNLFWRLISQPGGDAAINLSAFTSVAANTAALLDKVDQALLYGRMPAGLRSVIAAQVDAQGSDATARVRTALYFTALSGLHAVQH